MRHIRGAGTQTHISEWAARFQPEVATTEEITAAVKDNIYGCRIGDEADTMAAELTAILTYLINLTAQPEASSARVLNTIRLLQCS